jgi:hypothetical protein
LGNSKARFDGGNDRSNNHLKLIRNAHNVKGSTKEKEQQTDRMEDYLEVIYELIKKKGYATQTDISESLKGSVGNQKALAANLCGSGFCEPAWD